MSTVSLKSNLKELKLPVMADMYKKEALAAQTMDLGYEDYLLQLSNLELTEKRQVRINRLLRQSRLPLEKTLHSFDKKRLPIKIRGMVNQLVEGGFLKRKENLLIFGNPGSGKTHLLCGIGQELVNKGFKVLFKSCSMLVQDLLKAKKELKLAKTIKSLASNDALIIDDIGYVQQTREEMEVLFTLLAERYERGTVMISSNLVFSEWEKIFKDPMTTAAAIDRLVHHSIILELNLPSFRLETSKKNLKGEQ
ncbi:MAG TPA: IS21-like element helper ATPase IstB [Thermodesulfobacteriota bacterium]|nr:IS21-like element helper ATPase IstB [Thermodesulfobacteriota bacterium]